MNQLTEQEVLAVFQTLGLTTDADRAKFKQFSYVSNVEEFQDFSLVSFDSPVIEVEHAKLA